MRHKHSRFLFILLVVLLFVPSALAYWVWSPTESKFLGPKGEISQGAPEAEQIAGSPTDSVNSIVSSSRVPVQETIVQKQPQEQLQPLLPTKLPAEKKALAPTWLQMLTVAKEKLLKGKFLKPKSVEPQKLPEGQFWSPAEGRFISPTTAVIQKTADEQFQNALKLQKTGKEDQAIREYRRLVRQYPQSAYAAQAQYLVASYFEEKAKKPLRAAQEYEKLIRDFPRSEQIDEAIDHLFKLGNLFLIGEKQKVMGVSVIPVTSKAVEAFHFIVEHAPYGPYGDQAQLRLGTAYRKMGNFEEAVKAFETLIANYPNSPLVDEAHYQLAETSYELSQNVNRDQRALSQASTHLKEFIQQYSGSSLAERAQILKQQLDEQDAEKNYRVGLYYEKQGFSDSAMIYYEDVARHYAQTAFGKKAAERLQTLNQPVLAMKKGKEANEKRLAEVRSMLQVLDQEEARKGKGVKVAPETAQLRNQLQAELGTLASTQKKFQEESKENFRSRRKTLHEREKNLRGKFKIFEARKKLLKQNPSPELEEAFQKWQQSLLKEQEELARERKTLGAMGVELKGEKTLWFSWIPFLGEPKVPSGDRLVQFQNKKWAKLEEHRDVLRGKRESQQKQLADLAAELKELDQKEFALAKTTPLFQELLSSDLKKQKETLNQKRSQLDQSIQSFENAKQEYRAQYGDDFLKTLTLASNVKNLESAEQLIASGANLDQELEKLEKEKASLSEAWLAQKEKLSTLVRAVGKTQAAPTEKKPEQTIPFLDSLNQEEQAKAIRLLKKRMKYLEREMRSRMDQIQDWQHENAKRIDQLDHLLHPKVKSYKLGDTAGKMLSPATGTYKLAKAFLLGLPNRDRQLIEEAKGKMAEPQSTLSPEQTKAIRELEEEIELQSILIQGRAKEISDLESRLGELQKEAKQIPDFSYQSLLVPKIPSTLEYSLTSARELLGEQKQESVFVDRVNRQTRELERLENALNETSQKIEAVAIALERSKRSAPRPVLANVIPSLPGGVETLPTSSEEENARSGDEKRTQSESQLVHMKAEIDETGTRYEKGTKAFDEMLFHWYQTKAREKLVVRFPAEGKAIVDKKRKLGTKQHDIETSLTGVIRKEYKVAESQKEFLDQKLAEFGKRLHKIKNSSDPRYSALNEEMMRTTEMKDSLIHDLSFLESSLKK